MRIELQQKCSFSRDILEERPIKEAIILNVALSTGEQVFKDWCTRSFIGTVF
jgi:hypothetical protein